MVTIDSGRTSCSLEVSKRQDIGIYTINILFGLFFSWIKDHYRNPEVIITENGWSDEGELNDIGRIEYLNGHLQAVLDARLKDNCHVTGYTHWSVIDNFEWNLGYT